MTKKQKEDKVKEMEQFMNQGVPEEAKDKEYKWEQEPPICTYAIEPKQKINEKRLEVGNYKEANPVRSDDAKITANDNREEREETTTSERE